MTTTMTSRVVRDRQAESQADATISLVKRFGDQVPAAKIIDALRVAGWRDGADAVNRANDPDCGMPAGWQHDRREKGISELERRFGRLLSGEEMGAFRDGFDGAVNAGK